MNDPNALDALREYFANLKNDWRTDGDMDQTYGIVASQTQAIIEDVEPLLENLAQHVRASESARLRMRDMMIVLCDAASLFGARVMEREPGWFNETLNETDFADANDQLTRAILSARAALAAQGAK